MRALTLVVVGVLSPWTRGTLGQNAQWTNGLMSDTTRGQSVPLDPVDEALLSCASAGRDWNEACPTAARDTSGTYTGTSFTGRNFSSFNSEVLVVTVDGSDQTVALSTDIQTPAAAVAAINAALTGAAAGVVYVTRSAAADESGGSVSITSSTAGAASTIAINTGASGTFATMLIHAGTAVAGVDFAGVDFAGADFDTSGTVCMFNACVEPDRVACKRRNDTCSHAGPDDAVVVCQFQPGDGTGGTDTLAGPAANREECVDLVRRSHPAANGATFGTGGMASRSESCFAEFGMSRPAAGTNTLLHPPSASSRCSNWGIKGCHRNHSLAAGG